MEFLLPDCPSAPSDCRCSPELQSWALLQGACPWQGWEQAGALPTLPGCVFQDAARPAKPREDPLEDYQEDQEQEIEDHGGEVDDNDDLELVQEQKDRVGRQGGKKDDYF